MPEIPEDKFCVWLFEDNAVIGSEYAFLNFEPKYKTPKGAKIPVFIMYGKTEYNNEIRESEVLISTWNIENLQDIKKQLGTNTDNWSNELFFKLSGVTKENKFTLIPIESVK